ncbi:MAG: DUF192 domain-containing protein [Halanaeroarchaeum sp.]
MYVERVRNGETARVASAVSTADGLLAQMRGLMFRRSLPEDFALAFRFDDVATRDVHMLFVFQPLDVVWVREGTVSRIERLEPWTGLASGEADLLLELPAGGAHDIAPGDALRLVE